MPTACDHRLTEVTTEPQITRLQGGRTTADLATALTANCPHGHGHTLYIADISAMPDALSQIAEWAEDHADTCPGVDTASHEQETRLVTCYVAVCDLCGGSETGDGYTPHAETPQAVIDIVTEEGGDPTCGWTRTWDGRLVCDTVNDTAHRTAHEEAGKTVSACAMTVTFA